MKIIRRKALALFAGLAAAAVTLPAGFAQAADMPAPLDNPGNVKIALVRYLSTGQRKRAAIARLEAQRAPIWLLDEPLNGLDAKGVTKVGAMVEGHSRLHGICVLASHQPFPLNGLKTLDLAEYAA